jgi:Putative DNA-binding domain
MTPLETEAARQQRLLRAVWGEDVFADGAAPRLRQDAQLRTGLAAYRANAGALAERALAAAYPTVQQLLGEEAFAALARAHWHAQPPQAGDVALWGGSLPAYLAAARELAEEPYLPDMARLEWAVHEAERAADATPVQGLQMLATVDPDGCRLQFAAGTALIESAFPVASIWHAHRSHAEDRFAGVREALAAGAAESVLVQRQGWRVQVTTLDAVTTRFSAALLAGRSLAVALQAGGDGFDFEAWLIGAVQQEQLLSVMPMQESAACSTVPPPAS